MEYLLSIPKIIEKEVFTLKSQNKYYGIVQGDAEFFVSPEEFDSPLKAANHARSVARQLRKENKLVNSAHSLKKVEAPVIRSKVVKKKELFTEAEVAVRTHLKFKEVWVILNPDGRFVTEAIKNKTLVKYSSNRENALVFSSYEDALYTSTTLDMVVRKGHQLRRYFEKQR
jgi:hypothetical protein